MKSSRQESKACLKVNYGLIHLITFNSLINTRCFNEANTICINFKGTKSTHFQTENFPHYFWLIQEREKLFMEIIAISLLFLHNRQYSEEISNFPFSRKLMMKINSMKYLGKSITKWREKGESWVWWIGRPCKHNVRISSSCF